MINTGNKIIKSSLPLGVKTNNEAEYFGFIHALSLLRDENITCRNIIFNSDSQLVVEQLKGNWKVNEERLILLKELFFQKLNEIECFAEFVYIPRAKNKMADALAREAIKMNNIDF